MADKIVRSRPMWSFYILGTEKWLNSMSALGFELHELDFNGRFFFEKSEPRCNKYCFAYAKFGNVRQDKSRLKANGWQQMASHDKWSLYRCSKGESGFTPNRRGLYLRNNSLLCLYALLSSMLILIGLGITFGVLAYRASIGSNESFFAQALISIVAFVALLIGNFIFFLRLQSSNNRILEEPGTVLTPEYAIYKQYLRRKTFEDWLEKLLIKDGDIIRRFRLLWILSPRSFENWLSRMEKKGYNIYRVHKSGLLFYFTKGAPRKIRFCVINSAVCDVASYLNDGWQIIYSTKGFLGRLAVLSRAYEDEAPVAFSSRSIYIRNARQIVQKYAIVTGTVFLILLAAFLSFVGLKVWGACLCTGAALIICVLLIGRMLIYFAGIARTANGGNFKRS